MTKAGGIANERCQVSIGRQVPHTIRSLPYFTAAASLDQLGPLVHDHQRTYGGLQLTCLLSIGEGSEKVSTTLLYSQYR